MVRAKFICNSVVESKYQGGSSTKIILNAATAYNSDEADSKTFWDATPAGSLEIQIANKKAVEYFKPGKAYYLDFTEIES
jgi:hypothetical protein